jgi:hypothetical protein
MMPTDLQLRCPRFGRERIHGEDPRACGWPVWPESFRGRAAAAVSADAGENLDQVKCCEYRQWLAELQLDALGRRASDLRLFWIPEGSALYPQLPPSTPTAVRQPAAPARPLAASG